MPRVIFTQPVDVPAAANDNMLLFPAGKDPAAVLAWVRDCLKEVRAQHAISGVLLSCPRERRYWEQMRALERAIVWKYFRDR